ncbi:sensor histidine kinase [Paractinoplanes brasiliensis]|uniref:sensor histidine kinase n=1 Tax=Paractinoplanes brasiliensis TaxID=52695 RepID=UPI001EF3C3A2|nr:histidine kinase [Actinoplanes brasiliensis]
MFRRPAPTAQRSPAPTARRWSAARRFSAPAAQGFSPPARRWARWAAGWRARPVPVRDGLLALALALLAFVPPLSGQGTRLGELPIRPVDGLAVVAALAMSLPLTFRRRAPAITLTIVAAGFVVQELRGYGTFASIGLIIALFSAAAHLSRFRPATAVAAAVAYAGLVRGLQSAGSTASPSDYTIFFLCLCGAWAAGSWTRGRRVLEAERARRVAAEIRAAERAGIARELHDVVTHHVTAIVVQAGAAQFLTADPTRTAESLTAIGDTGRRALAELRDLLEVLNPDRVTASPTHPSPSPAPSASGPPSPSPDQHPPAPRTASPFPGLDPPTASTSPESPARSSGSPAASLESPSHPSGPPTPSPGPAPGLQPPSAAPRSPEPRSPLTAPNPRAPSQHPAANPPAGFSRQAPRNRQPGMSDVSLLVEQVRGAGQPVELVEDGHPAPLGEGRQITAYRVVQECLTNAMKYAPGGRTVVRLDHRPDGVRIEVTTDPVDGASNPAGSSGRGLAGLRARVEVFGGELTAGPRPDQVFAVTAHIPTEASP